MPITDEILTTDVDSFIELVKKQKKVALADAARILNIPIATIQAWTDFLVEEKILGIEYKFTTPYVYYIEEKKKLDDVSYIGFDTKEAFFEKARQKGIRDSHINLLWAKYLTANKETIKKVFCEKSKEKGLDDVKTEHLWKKYLEYLEGA